MAHHHDSVDLRPLLASTVQEITRTVYPAHNLIGSRDRAVDKDLPVVADDGMSHGRDRAPNTKPKTPRCI